MTIFQLLFLLCIIYSFCDFLYEVARSGLIYNKVDATITSCDTPNFTYIFNDKTYGPFKVSRNYVKTCKIGDSYQIKVNPFFPSNYDDEDSYVGLGYAFFTMMLMFNIGLIIIYRVIFKV